MKKIGIIGCGKLGAPCANEMLFAGHDVVGYDVVHNDVAKFPLLDSIEDVVRDRDIIFIAVPTPHNKQYGGETPSSHLPPMDFDYSIVESVLEELSKYCTKDQIVVLISTVLPGTVRNRFKKYIQNFKFVYNPYLIAMGSVSWDMVNPEMVIIGTEYGENTEEAQTIVDFYKTMMQNNPRYVVGTWDEAEAIKIFYNTFISAKISLVNMIQDVAEVNGNINVDVVTTALADSDRRIMGKSYMKAGMGDAGACHPRDNIALRWMANNLRLEYDLFGSIMESRELQARRLASKLVQLSKQYSLPIYIHGKAYKPGVPNLDGSYSLLVGYYIKDISGIDPIYIDPLTGDVVDSVRGVVLMAHHAPTTYSHSRLIGSETQNFYCNIEEGSVIVDVWRYLKQEDLPDCVLLSYGSVNKYES
jgi:UDPglucose 6-dehydrogenase